MSWWRCCCFGPNLVRDTELHQRNPCNGNTANWKNLFDDLETTGSGVLINQHGISFSPSTNVFFFGGKKEKLLTELFCNCYLKYNPSQKELESTFFNLSLAFVRSLTVKEIQTLTDCSFNVLFASPTMLFKIKYIHTFPRFGCATRRYFSQTSRRLLLVGGKTL